MQTENLQHKNSENTLAFKSDPVITYDHMAEDDGTLLKYFRREQKELKTGMLLFILEECLILSLTGILLLKGL